MLRHIKEVLQNMKNDGYINDETIFLDVFGGSGLISHNVKVWYPQNEVIWNDFDNYEERLDNINDTEKIRQELSKILIKADKNKLESHIREKVLNLLIDFEKQGFYMDFTQISNYILFSGTYAKNMDKIKRATLFNRITITPIESINYLKNVKRIRLDFKDLLDSYANIKNKILILDPPYLQTQKGNYKDSYQLKDFFQLIKRISKPYIFFGSKKSDILDCFMFLQEYNEELKDFTFNKAGLLRDIDYIIYPQKRSLFNNLTIAI